MKKILFAIFFLVPLFSSGQGVNFKEMSLNEIIETAKAENKYVFLIYGFNQCGFGMKSSWLSLLRADRKVLLSAPRFLAANRCGA